MCPKWCGKGKSVRLEDIEEETLHLLSNYSITPETFNLVSTNLRKAYYQRVTTLQKRREHADVELKKLYDTRQALIEKNLAGIYSDDMFKEQNKLLEERIATAQLTKNDELITKYNIENVTLFIGDKFSNLAKTYANSDLQQKRMLMCSLFPSGLVWNYPGYVNTQISTCFQSICEPNNLTVNFGWGGGIRTPECRRQRPVPYHLATPQSEQVQQSSSGQVLSPPATIPKSSPLLKRATLYPRGTR